MTRMKSVTAAVVLMVSPAVAQVVVPQQPLPGEILPVPLPPPGPNPAPLPGLPNYQPTPPPIPPTVAVPAYPGVPAYESPGTVRPRVNTFTEQQVRSKLMANGYSSIAGLSVDGTGTWRGTAVINGQNVGVTVDSNGMISPR